MDIQKFLESTQVNPKKILKIVVSISVVMLVMWLFMVSRMEVTEQSRHADPQTIERTDSLRAALSRNETIPGTAERSRPGIFMNAFTTFMVLIFVLVVVLILIRNKNNEMKQDFLTELGDHSLGQGARIKIIEMNQEIWILGIAPSNVSLLHRYQKKEWKEVMMKTPGEKSNFYNIFKSKT